MKTINEIKPLKKVRTRVKGLIVSKGFYVVIQATLKGYHYVSLELRLSDDSCEAIEVPLPDALPTDLIPKFAITSECFQNECDEDFRTVYEIAMAMILASRASVSLSIEDDKLITNLKIDYFTTESETPLREVGLFMSPK